MGNGLLMVMLPIAYYELRVIQIVFSQNTFKNVENATTNQQAREQPYRKHFNWYKVYQHQSGKKQTEQLIFQCFF